MAIDLTNIPKTPVKRRQHLKWKQITEKLKANPGEWVQLIHTYSSNQSARVGVYQAAKKHGFAHRMSTRDLQDNGLIAIFLCWNADQA